VKQAAPHVLWSGIEDGSRFYFVHSYFPQTGEAALVRGTTDYGVPFTCAWHGIIFSRYSSTRKKRYCRPAAPRQLPQLESLNLPISLPGCPGLCAVSRLNADHSGD